MTTAVVLQARMGSTRLPGKVLAEIGGRTVLAHCIERLRATSGLPVIVATTTRPEDHPVAREAARLHALVVRGSETDVLGRFVQAAREFALTEVVRATADNPAVDLDAPGRALELLRRAHADCVVERGLPHGACVEAVTAAALETADALTIDAYDREHVTPFIRRDRRFRSFDALGPGHVRRPSLRLTVDTPDDLDQMRRVFAMLGSNTLAPLSAIIAAVDRLAAVDRESSGASAR
ncbi:MAG: cytidylyltransferase domain-containing protein [Vicinamibacterales bacterium]